jgi:DNA modification methylase
MTIDLPTADEPVRIIEGDCLQWLPRLPAGRVDACVSDPPYGMGWDTDSTRFSGGKGCHNKRSTRIHGDSEPFDPTPLLAFPRVVLWGYHHFAQRLPVGSVLVWVKKSDAKIGAFLSDAELAWTNAGHGVYVKRIVWDGCARETENGEHHHPTQKPVRLMEWCIERLKLKPGSLIIDPYAGSGTTGVAAIKCGMRCILIERDPGTPRMTAQRGRR